MSNNCNASASKGTNAELEAYNPPHTSDKKYLISVDLEGVKGKDEAKWSSRCGALIRCHIPIGYDKWRNVDDYYKNILWQELLVCHEFILFSHLCFAQDLSLVLKFLC